MRIQEYEVMTTTGIMRMLERFKCLYKILWRKGESSETILNPVIKGNAFEKGNTDIELLSPNIGKSKSHKNLHDNKYLIRMVLNKIVC